MAVGEPGQEAILHRPLGESIEIGRPRVVGSFARFRNREPETLLEETLARVLEKRDEVLETDPLGPLPVGPLVGHDGWLSARV